MIARYGNMWDVLPTLGQTDLFCITTNAQVRKDGGLVMGRGIAKQAILKFPELQIVAGRAVSQFIAQNHSTSYGVLIIPPHTIENQPFSFGLYQVKHHWINLAETSLIERSAEALVDLLPQFTGEVHLNFPGIGNGGLPEQAVRASLTPLENTKVQVWRFRSA